jgi:hypothetical protein
MKRLFEVNGEFFASKSDAKKARGDATNPAIPADPTVYGSKTIPARFKHQVSRGPDHWKEAK